MQNEAYSGQIVCDSQDNGSIQVEAGQMEAFWQWLEVEGTDNGNLLPTTGSAFFFDRLLCEI